MAILIKYKLSGHSPVEGLFFVAEATKEAAEDALYALHPTAKFISLSLA